MDDYSSKRRNDGLFVSRKGSSLALRDATASNKDQSPQFCTRIGCSGRLNSAKATQINYSAKPKFSRPSIRSASSTGKEIVASSSPANLAIRNTRKSFPSCAKKFPSRAESDSSENASVVEDEPDVHEIDPPLRKLHKGDHQSCSATISTQVRSTSLASCTLSNGDFHRKSMLGNPNTLASTSSPLSLKNTVQGRYSNVGRNGLRNFRCNSVTDAVSSSSSSSLSSSSSSSSSDLNLNKRKDPLKKRVFHGESSSSARGKKTSGSSPEGLQSSTSRVFISDARRARIGPTIRDNPVSSVRTRRSITGYSYNRSLGTRNNLSVSEVVPQVPNHDISFDLSNSTSSHQLFVEPSLDCPSLNRIGSSGGRSSRGIRRPSSPAEIDDMRSLLNRESSRRYNMDGIAEVMLALEGLGQDEELTYEQLLVLETNLFLTGLNLHDQHRDMRLDIDNMSYEELLALEDRMGTVSTGVKDEELTRCLESSIYQVGSMEGAFENLGADTEDTKCSICQEEYEEGDELRGLKCEHKYHMKCIHQWLRLKNWCPVCKASAVPTLSSLLMLPPHFDS